MRKRFDLNRDGKVDFWDHFLAYGAHEAAREAVRHGRRNDSSEAEEYKWREEYEGDTAYDVDPEDYETEEEFLEAVNEEKYGWREACEDGLEYDVDPEDYETEEEFLEALDEEKYGWRETCEDGLEYDIYPEDYETEEEYMDALEDAYDS